MSGKYGYEMGVPVGDPGNDGDADSFFSNVGTAAPDFMVKGDLNPETFPSSNGCSGATMAA